MLLTDYQEIALLISKQVTTVFQMRGQFADMVLREIALTLLELVAAALRFSLTPPMELPMSKSTQRLLLPISPMRT